MKQLNRTLLTLVLAIGLLLVWSAVSRTAWASSVSLLGIGDNYTNAFQPLLKIVVVTTVAVTGVQLIHEGFKAIIRRRHKPRVTNRSAEHTA